jgi:hypothetical protein
MTEVLKKMIQYDMNDYEEIMNAGFTCNLTQETLNIISKLSEQVGAPTYIKTPIFLKKEGRVVGLGLGSTISGMATSGLGIGSGISGGFKKNKNRAAEITDEDWETIRQFQTTTKHISEGIQKNMENIRGYLNKMSEATFDKMVNEIKMEISQLIEHETTDENMMKIGYSIFSIASSNSFYSELYAKLFKILMEEYEVFKKIFEDNYKVFMNLFDNIEYVDPKKNYDKFCEYTKTNDNRRAMSLFIVNLMKNGVIEKENILEIIINLQKLIIKYISKQEKTNEVEELNENLFIIITNSSNKIKFGVDEGTENIIKDIEFISKLKPKMKEYPSITNKTIFKHMDIISELK